MYDLLLYLVAAYTIVWVALFAYLLFVAGALRGLQREVADLRALVAASRAPEARSGELPSPPA